MKNLFSRFHHKYLFVPFLIGAFFIIVPRASAALINADGVIGHIDINNNTNYTEKGPNNTTTTNGFNYPMDSGAVDTVNHRLFTIDSYNHRILVFALDSNDNIVSQTPINVLGQNNLDYLKAGTSRSALNYPWGLAYDSVNRRLFVADSQNNRVLIFNVDPGYITNNENADYVLGQSNFTNSGSGATQSTMYFPMGLDYDSATNRLFVADTYNSRVLVFDVNPAIVTSGENATSVIGQANFTTVTFGTAANKLYYPADATYDTNNNRLFVTDWYNNRVMVFNAASGTLPVNNASAVNVLGQTLFTTRVANVTQTSFWGPKNSTYDILSNRLFVTDNSNNRLMVFDVATSTIVNNKAASNVLGQTLFTTGVVSTTQNGLNSPAGAIFDPTNKHLFVADWYNNRIMVFNAATSSIANGANAIDLLGQTNTDGSKNYTTKLFDNSPTNASGFNNLPSATIDTVNHRLFVADKFNYRVLVYPLSSSNKMTTTTPNYVLGQSNFTSGIGPSLSRNSFGGSVFNLLYDSNNNRLFLADGNNNRVLIFDVAPGTISSNMNASFVLGQSGFTTKVSAATQSGMYAPDDMAYDSKTNRLFVADAWNNRVLVFNVTPGSVSNGMNAVNVLGQNNFASSSAATSINGMYIPTGLAYDSANDRLIVDDSFNNRILFFNAATSTIVNGSNSLNVIGQSNFTSNIAASTINGLNNPDDIIGYDSATGRLFIDDDSNNRVMIFDVSTSTIANGKNAQNVIGQSNFTDNSLSGSQSTFGDPNGTATFDPVNNVMFVADKHNNRMLQFSMIKINNASLANGNVSRPYSQTISTSFSQGSQSFQLVSGVLPAGLSLSTSTGIISGTPTSVATSTFTIEADDNFNTGQLFDRAVYTMNIGPATPPLPPTSLLVSNLSTSTLTLTWTDNSDNEDGFLVRKSLDGNTFTDLATTSPNINTLPVNGLSPYTHYYFEVASYNTNSTSSFAFSMKETTVALSSTGGMLITKPIPPTGGYKLMINDGQGKTDKQNVRLKFVVGNDINRMTVFNNPESKNLNIIKYQEEISWDIGSQIGNHMVCAKFFNQFGLYLNVVCSAITYTPPAKRGVAAKAPEKCIVYKVKKGDSLPAIALKTLGGKYKQKSIVDQNSKKYPTLKKGKLGVNWQLNICQTSK
ncbi:MAG: putative Ig domain-containing protein [Candidatus Falkowbacteria bacterium]|nr:putative Ig domain-containing protein [Candidatus Falkowbacteria bacterium]